MNKTTQVVEVTVSTSNKQPRRADNEFGLEEQDMKYVIGGSCGDDYKDYGLTCVTPCSLADRYLDNPSSLKMESAGQ
jgi:hypothetical protein